MLTCLQVSAIQWLASQHDTQVTHAIILTDSMNLLQMVMLGMGCPDWHSHAQSSATKTSVDLLPWECRIQWE